MKNFYRIFSLLVIALVVVNSSVNAQSVQATNAAMSDDSSLLDEHYIYSRFTNTVGAEYTQLTGYGLFYKLALRDNVQLKITGVPYYYATQNESEELYDVGFQLQLDFFKQHTMRGYGLFGGSYSYHNTTSTYPSYGSTPETTNANTNTGFTLAVGLGVEMPIYKRLIWHAELTGGYLSQDSNQDFVRKLAMGVGGGIGIVF